jgi:hypothetical protein
MDLVSRYINRGRFGEFVSEFLKLEMERKKDEAEMEKHRELWAAYIHSYSNESFTDWKKRVLKPVSTTKGASRDDELDVNSARDIINDIFPSG